MNLPFRLINLNFHEHYDSALEYGGIVRKYTVDFNACYVKLDQLYQKSNLRHKYVAQLYTQRL